MYLTSAGAVIIIYTSVNVEHCGASLSEQSRAAKQSSVLWLTESHLSLITRLQVMHVSEHTVMHSSYTVSYLTVSRHLRSVSSHVCLHNLQPSYSKLSCSSYILLPSVSLRRLRPLESQSENVTYRPHAARGSIKLQSRQTYGIRTTDI